MIGQLELLKIPVKDVVITDIEEINQEYYIYEFGLGMVIRKKYKKNSNYFINNYHITIINDTKKHMSLCNLRHLKSSLDNFEFDSVIKILSKVNFETLYNYLKNENINDRIILLFEELISRQ